MATLLIYPTVEGEKLGLSRGIHEVLSEDTTLADITTADFTARGLKVGDVVKFTDGLGETGLYEITAAGLAPYGTSLPNVPSGTTLWKVLPLIVKGSTTNPVFATANKHDLVYRLNNGNLEVKFFYIHTVAAGSTIGAGTYTIDLTAPLADTAIASKINIATIKPSTLNGTIPSGLPIGQGSYESGAATVINVIATVATLTAVNIILQDNVNNQKLWASTHFPFNAPTTSIMCEMSIPLTGS